VLTCPVCTEARVRPARGIEAAALLRCPRCGLLFTREPSPVAREGAVMADAERRLEERVARRRAAHFARVLAQAGPPGRVLDVGTGIGTFLDIAGRAGWQAVGVDVDAAAVACAGARGLDARAGELRAVDLPAASFDLVTLWNVLDFVADPVALLGDCHRLLAPRGRLFVRTPNAAFQRHGARLGRALAAVGLARLVADRPRRLAIFHASNFGARALRVALARAGYRRLVLRNSAPIPGDPYGAFDGVSERTVTVAKHALFGAAQAAALASGGRWLIGPSLEAWAERPA
jgi:SAM-dependent methyltransferase